MTSFLEDLKKYLDKRFELAEEEFKNTDYFFVEKHKEINKIYKDLEEAAERIDNDICNALFGGGKIG